MKRTTFLIAFYALLPAPLSAREVRIRLYTTQPPEAILLRATDGELRWKRCLDCREEHGRELAIGPEEESASEEFYVTGSYELRPASGPPLAVRYPVEILPRQGHLLITATIPLEEYVALTCRLAWLMGLRTGSVDGTRGREESESCSWLEPECRRVARTCS
jgi:hypothetical protein